MVKVLQYEKLTGQTSFTGHNNLEMIIPLEYQSNCNFCYC